MKCPILPAGAAFVLLTGMVYAQAPGARITTPYKTPSVRAVGFTNTPKLGELIRGGKLYLSLDDAIGLAIENNLDIEYQRFNRNAAQWELLRARGGGVTRGLAMTVSEAPAGVGGPSAPIVTSPATRNAASANVSVNPVDLGGLGQVQNNLQITGTVTPAAGTVVPIFDPGLTGNLNWQHASAPQSNPLVTGITNLVTDTTVSSIGYRQGFSSGGQLNVSFDNTRQQTNSLRTNYTPFTLSGLGMTFRQPLLRGFGFSVNRRFIHIARNENKLVDALFRQQLITSVYGVTRLYYDLLALYQDVTVKEQTLAFADRLLSDTRAQVEQGTAAQVEVARANAQVFSARQDLERSRGLLEEQEAVLKTYLSRRGMSESSLQGVSIVPTTTDGGGLPPEQARPVDDLVSDAFRNRGDLEVAQLQLTNLNLNFEGTRSALRPQLDLVAVAQNVGMAGQANPNATGAVDPTFIGSYGSVLGQIFGRNYPVYGAGLQLDLPFRNRIAQADAARDQVMIRQTEIRLQQLRNQVRLEVEDALIAMRRARSAYEAAVEARKLQEQSLELEQARFTAGVSTSFFVLQYQSFLAQARSSEVVSRNAYVKARAALQRAAGTILDEHNVSFNKAVEGQK